MLADNRVWAPDLLKLVGTETGAHGVPELVDKSAGTGSTFWVELDLADDFALPHQE